MSVERVRNIRMVLEYDGTLFLGFQKQKKGRTVQSELEKTLTRILQERVHVVPAGRTDSGVHAKGQAVHFLTRSGLPLKNLVRALNTYLPDDLAVKEATLVPRRFHARYQASRKVYVYRILTGETPSPLSRHYAYHFRYPLNLIRIRQAVKLLRGKRDFRSFQARADERNSVRTLYRLDIKKQRTFVIFTFEGDGFLYNMVRNIVGTLLWLGRGKISLGQFKKILEARDRRLAGPTAPPHGLTLEKVVYDRD